jgi:hypothetical protein
MTFPFYFVLVLANIYAILRVMSHPGIFLFFLCVCVCVYVRVCPDVAGFLCSCVEIDFFPWLFIIFACPHMIHDGLISFTFAVFVVFLHSFNYCKPYVFQSCYDHPLMFVHARVF